MCKRNVTGDVFIYMDPPDILDAVELATIPTREVFDLVIRSLVEANTPTLYTARLLPHEILTSMIEHWIDDHRSKLGDMNPNVLFDRIMAVATVIQCYIDLVFQQLGHGTVLQFKSTQHHGKLGYLIHLYRIE